MSTTIISVLVAVIGSTGLYTLVQSILKRHWDKQDAKAAKDSVDPQKIDAICNAIKVLMVDRINYLGTCHIYSGEITMEEKNTITDMYDAYKQLPGSNGHCKGVMEEVNKVKVVKEKYKDKQED